MRRSPWFWLSVIVAAVAVGLTVGTISANRLNQSVEWYAGVGGWLGALGSLLAAGMALWIATSGRQEAVKERQRVERKAQDERRAEKAQIDADLLREAGLVRLMDLRNTPDMDLDDLSGRSDAANVGVTVRNFRADRICDLDLSVVATTDEAVDHRWTKAYPSGHENSQVEPEKCSVAPDGELYLHARLRSRAEGVRVVVKYTDQRGRRWQVDTDGTARHYRSGLPCRTARACPCRAPCICAPPQRVRDTNPQATHPTG